MEKMNEEIQGNNKKCKDRTANPGKKLPWYIAYPILLIIFSICVWMIYKAININNTKEVFSTIEYRPFTISINKEIIGRGENLKINVQNGDENTILESSNPEIIQVEGNSIIGLQAGEAYIYARKNEEISNKLNIKCIVKLEKIEIDKNKLEIVIGSKDKITATPFPEDATDVQFIYKSENENIAKVNDGIVEGVKEGETSITITDKNEEIKAICKVIVKPVEVTSVTLDDSNVNLGVGQNYILTEYISPANATYKNIVWSSSNTNVITVDNGKIKAAGEGSATVSATTKNGIKGTCNFTVTSSNPNNSVKYVTNTFNVRSGPSTNYSVLDTVSKNDEIEILKEGNGYTKIRIIKNGIVGYTMIKSYSSERSYYIDNVPFLNQISLGYPTGCEAVSATMAARFSGYSIGVQTIVDNTPTDSLGKRQETRTKEIEKEVLNEETGETEIITETEEETVWIGENPFKYFVGYPTNGQSQGSYGCFAAPIVTALRNSGVPCSNISGSSIDTVYSYIRQGKPVIVWGRRNALDLTEGVTWEYPDGSGSFLELVGEHCFVLIGYDGEYVYLNDPIAGAGVKQPKWKFESNWHKLYNQAIIIN